MKCDYPLCEKMRARGRYCNAHRIQKSRRGFERMFLASAFTDCVYEGCISAIFSRNLCSKHYEWIHGRGRSRTRRAANPKLQTCSVIDCEKSTRRSLMCSAHEAICRKYNLSCIQLSFMIQKSEGKCEICGCIDRKLFIDHDHSCCPDEPGNPHSKRCGECNRGLICGNCNFGIECFSENIDSIERAKGYLGGDISRIFIMDDCMGEDDSGSRTWQSRWYLYKIGPKRFDAIMLHQNNRCGVCEKDFSELHIDHCHTSYAVRGFLCRNCNHGLGQVNDDREILSSMIEYIKKYKMEMI